MWFGAMFTILVELVPPSIRSSAFGVAFFIMENVGGNLPIIVEYLTSLVGYRTALTIMYPGQLLASKKSYKLKLRMIFINNFKSQRKFSSLNCVF